MRAHRLTVATAAGLALAACGVHPAPQSSGSSPHVTASPTASPTYPGRETQPQPVEARFPDCGDGNAPCVTYDDGPQGNGMYLVTSYQPYKATKIPTCDAEDYPTNMPCVWKHPDAKTGEWITLRKPV